MKPKKELLLGLWVNLNKTEQNQIATRMFAIIRGKADAGVCAPWLSLASRPRRA